MNLREIDFLIAEKVMGWTLWNYAVDRNARIDERERAKRAGGFDWRERKGVAEARDWSPTTDAKCCEELRAKLTAACHAWQLLSPSTRVPSFGFVIDRGMEVFVETATTETLTCCLCALKAFGIEVPE